MNKYGKVVLSSFLLFNLFASTIHAEDISVLKAEQEEANEKKEEYEEELEHVHEDITKLEEEITIIIQQVKKTDEQIATTQKQIDKTVKEIEKTEKEIEKTTIELEEKKEILAKNLRKMHMKGNVTMLEYLFRSENVSDFFDRFDLMKRIADANKKLYEEVRELKEHLEQQKAYLEAEKVKQETAKSKLVTLKTEQEANKKKQEALLKELYAHEEHLQKEIEEQNNAMAAIQAQIDEEIRKREEERKKREEAQSNGQNVVFDDPVGTGQFMIPVKNHYFTSEYGYRIHPVTGEKQSFHNGIDIVDTVNGMGAPIYAADAGTVLYAGPASGYGNWIVIDHNNGYYTTYGHMKYSSIRVVPGQKVARGEHIAAVGSEGRSTGPHLHFVVSVNGIYNYLNPRNFF